MIVCWKCGNVYDTPRVVKATRDNPGAALCPACRAPFDGEWAKKCDVCGEWKHPEDMASSSCCNACADAAADDPEQFSKFLADTEIEDEFFVDFLLNKDELLAYGMAKFAAMSQSEKLAHIKDFVSGDRAQFAEWLEVQNE